MASANYNSFFLGADAGKIQQDRSGSSSDKMEHLRPGSSAVQQIRQSIIGQAVQKIRQSIIGQAVQKIRQSTSSSGCLNCAIGSLCSGEHGSEGQHNRRRQGHEAHASAGTTVSHQAAPLGSSVTAGRSCAAGKSRTVNDSSVRGCTGFIVFHPQQAHVDGDLLPWPGLAGTQRSTHKSLREPPAVT